MITIKQNKNFPKWINICLRGKLVDNAIDQAKAMEIAKKIQKVEQSKTRSPFLILQK